MRKFISRLTSAHLLAILALFMSTAGTSYATATYVSGQQIVNNSITTADIRNGSVHGVDIWNNSVSTWDIANNSLTGADVRDGALGYSDLSSGVRNLLKDSPCDHDSGHGNDWKCYGSEAVSGETVRGVWGTIQYTGDTDLHTTTGISLPAKATDLLTDETVNFAASDALAMDGDPECTGTYEEPTAPPGRVCIYVDEYSNPGGTVESRGYASPSGSYYGFFINHRGTPGVDLTGGWGSWAYTPS